MKSLLLSAVFLSLVSLAHAQTPVVNAGGVVNAGSYATGGVAPGSIVSIFGTNLASQPAEAASIPLPTTLANVQSVTFSGIPAHLYFVSPLQINAQIPWNVLPSGSSVGTVPVVVTTSGGSSAPQSVAVVQALPGIFTTSANGLGQGIATNNADSAIAAPTASLAGLFAHPIRIGDYLVVWCTGLGAVDIAVDSGANTGGQVANTLAKPAVVIGGVTATPVYSILSTQFVGEYQLAVQVARGTPTGVAVPLQIQVSGVTTSNSVDITVAPAFLPTPLDTSCTLTSSGCTQIGLSSTDPYSQTVFSGYADPTIRQDPQTGTLWMAYSWPHTVAGANGGTQAIDTHVSYSTDGGKTWTYKGPLYTSQAVPNAVTGQTDYTANEVMNLFSQVVNGVTYWYGIHSLYNVPQASGGGSGLENYSKRWEIAVAPGDATTGPMGLATATPQFLGQSVNTYPQDFPIAVNLSALDPEVSSCAQFYEPALIIENNTLYLFLSCQSTGGPADMFYAVFKTSNPLPNAPNWQWAYVPQGATKFANADDAISVGSLVGTGTTYLTQGDIAPGKQPGSLVFIATAAYNNSTGKVGLGCAAIEMANVDPPMFIRDAQGQPQVDAFISSSISATTGPGACTYSPYSATGMIMAYKQMSKAPENNGFFIFLTQSFLFP